MSIYGDIKKQMKTKDPEDYDYTESRMRRFLESFRQMQKVDVPKMNKALDDNNYELAIQIAIDIVEECYRYRRKTVGMVVNDMVNSNSYNTLRITSNNEHPLSFAISTLASKLKKQAIQVLKTCKRNIDPTVWKNYFDDPKIMEAVESDTVKTYDELLDLVLEFTNDSHTKNIKTWKVLPGKSIGPIRFGMSREEVRGLFDQSPKTFKKTKASKSETDDFGDFHVYYSESGTCELVEVFDNIKVTLGKNILFPTTEDNIKKNLQGITKSAGGYVCASLAIAFSVDGDKIHAISAGAKGYFEN